jgi:hypothetical protein
MKSDIFCVCIVETMLQSLLYLNSMNPLFENKKGQTFDAISNKQYRGQ